MAVCNRLSGGAVVVLVEVDEVEVELDVLVELVDVDLLVELVLVDDEVEEVEVVVTSA